MKRLDPRKDLTKTAIHACMLAFFVLAVGAVNGAESRIGWEYPTSITGSATTSDKC
jgi:hypothetical protein